MPFFKKTPSVFPSYEQTYKKIKANQKQHHQNKLTNVTTKIQKLKSKINLTDQHRKLAKKLIDDYKQQPLYQKPSHQEISDLAVINCTTTTTKYASSLNEYLQNSEEEQNNYEAHLKFRKKALQRELNQDDDDLRKTKSKKAKTNTDESELFYRNLFNNPSHHKQNKKKEQLIRNTNMIQNKKKLMEIYLPYVQALSNTNIVKWRILN